MEIAELRSSESPRRGKQLESHVAREGIAVESRRRIDDDTDGNNLKKSVDAEKVKRKFSSQSAPFGQPKEREKKNWWFDMLGLVG